MGTRRPVAEKYQYNIRNLKRFQKNVIIRVTLKQTSTSAQSFIFKNECCLIQFGYIESTKYV